MAYIALKPVRFKRDYAVSEIIPDFEIDPKMAKRLIEWGKIAFIGENAPASSTVPSDLNDTGAGDNLPAEADDSEQGENAPAAEADNNKPHSGKHKK